MTEELERLQSRNPRYSLRSYARKLGISPSQACDLLSGKRIFSAALARKILSMLEGVEDAESQVLIEACSVERRGRKKTSQRDKADIKEFVRLTADQFRLMGDWKSFAILSLAETVSFKDDPNWIGRILQIDPRQAAEALARLERLGALQRNEAGQLKHAGIQFASTTDVPSLAIRRAHRERLELAKESLEVDPITERDITGITMAIDPAKLPEAQERIRRFRHELSSFLESGEKKRVYHLALQLFPMSRKEES